MISITQLRSFLDDAFNVIENGTDSAAYKKVKLKYKTGHEIWSFLKMLAMFKFTYPESYEYALKSNSSEKYSFLVFVYLGWNLRDKYTLLMER